MQVVVEVPEPSNTTMNPLRQASNESDPALQHVIAVDAMSAHDASHTPSRPPSESNSRIPTEQELREQESLDAALMEATEAAEAAQRKGKKVAARKSRSNPSEPNQEAREKLQAARDFIQKAGLSPRSSKRREQEEIPITTFDI